MEILQQYAYLLIPAAVTALVLLVGWVRFKPFFWRMFLCILPVALAGVVTLDACLNYSHQEHQGFRFNLGVDLAGGTILIYEVDRDWWNTQSENQKQEFSADKLAEILKRRIDPANLLEIVIRPIKADPPRVEIILPVRSARGGVQGTAEIEGVKKKISQVGELKFRLLADSRDENGEAVLKAAEAAVVGFVLDAKNIPPPPDDAVAWVELAPEEVADQEFTSQTPAGFQRRNTLAYYHGTYQDLDPKTNEPRTVARHFVLTRIPSPDELVTGEDLASANPDMRDGRWVVIFTLRPDGADRMWQLTKPKGHFMAIILDNRVMSAPTLIDRLRDSGVITMGKERGAALKKKVDDLVLILRTGALPATLSKEPASTETMGPTLGEDTIRKGAWSIVLAFGAVVLFMIIYYRWAGGIASSALFANLLITVGFMVAVKAVFTLPGLAGLVLTLGMAVDANVLIYERVREERERGAGLALAIRNGYARAFPTIIDTHLTSIFTAIVLYAVGNDQLKGFGVSLTAGLLISLFTSLYMTRLAFDILLANNWLGELRMMKFFSKPNIDFMGVRYYWFTATVALSLLGVLVFALRGEKGLSIDFTGGTSYKIEFKEPEGIETIRSDVMNATFTACTLQLQEPLRPDDVQKTLASAPDTGRLPDFFVLPQYPAGESGSGGRETQTYLIYTTAKDRAKVQADLTTLFSKQAATATTAEATLPDASVYTIYPKSFGFSRAEGAIGGRYEGFVESGSLTPNFMIRTTLKNRNLVQWMVSQVFGKHLIWSEAQAGPVTTLAEERLPKQFDLTVTNTGATVETVSRLVGEWMKDHGVALPDQYYQVTSLSKPREPGAENDLESAPLAVRVQVYPPDGTTAEELAAYLTVKDGPLYQPKSDGVQNIDTQLAGETQSKALVAILLSWLAISGYLWFRFGSWTFGVAAVLCLIHDLCFAIGLIGLAHYLVVYTPIGSWLLLEDFKLDLPAVAALLTLVGYSVNDTIVVFDRIREVRGKSPELTPQMINDSVNQTLSRTLLASLTTWLVVFVLYIAGGEGVHLFSFVMVVGVIIGTYSSIFVASPLLLMFGEGKQATPVRQRQLQEAAT